jgi:hypothetical protein
VSQQPMLDLRAALAGSVTTLEGQIIRLMTPLGRPGQMSFSPKPDTGFVDSSSKGH